MSEITLAQLTTGALDGTGVFDTLMRAAKTHLDKEFKDGRIRGPEYSTVYLGQLDQAMQTGLAFLSQSQRIGLEAALLEKQIALADKQLAIADAQLAQTQAQTALVQAQMANITAEKALIEANTAKAEAETLNIPKQGLQIDAQTALVTAQKTNVDAQVELTVQQKANAIAEAAQIAATTARVEAETLNVPKQGLLLDQQLVLVTQQAVNAEVDKRLLEAKVCESQATFDLINQNVLKSASETTLLTQKVATEKAQILNLGVEDNSVIGRQKNLYLAQTNGFTRDAEQKVASLFMDAYKTFRMTDSEFPIPDSLNSFNLGKVLEVVKKGINVPEEPAT